jgi:alkylhydroperoxidase family enzyme
MVPTRDRFCVAQSRWREPALDGRRTAIDALLVASDSVPEVVSRAGPLVDALVTAVLETPGATDPATRRLARSGTTDNEVFGAYLDKVRQRAYRIVDSDVDALTAAGLSDDAIFEVTVATALGAAERRLTAGLSLLGR